MTRTTIDVHILQTVPPSNLNRDDTGSPKTAVYGGVRRARVSSQAWKRATRKAFEGELDRSELGVRTKRVVELVATEITAQAPHLEDTATTLASKALAAAKIKLTAPRTKKGEEPKPEVPGYLLFLSRHQVTRLAELAVEAERAGGAVDGKAAKAAVDSSHSIDLALFGRMVADDAELNVDAAAQVAHAISVHAAETEYDYYTAVDDRKEDQGDTDAGAAMIGTVEFTSSTLYRYATVNVDELHRTLGDDKATGRAVRAFLRSFVTSMPTGKQNTFANRTLPDAVVVTVRDGQSVNLVGAFEDPVTAGPGGSRLALASQRLAAHAAEVDQAYGTTPLASWVVAVGAAVGPLDGVGERVSLDGMLDGVGALVSERLHAEPRPTAVR